MTVYGIAHAAVDATCVALVFSLPIFHPIAPAEFLYLVIIYNILAFGLQSVFGLMADHLRSAKLTALWGLILTGVSIILFYFSPVAAIILISIGNALFHVGAGSISLNLTPKKATAPGIFVAPGTIGVLVGTLIGKTGNYIGWPFLLLILILCIAVSLMKEPVIDYGRLSTSQSGKPNYFEMILILVLVSVAVRALVGAALVFPWKADMILLLILTLSVFLGKSLGGVLADRFGWMRIAVGSLLVSIPLLVFGANIPALAIVGIFCFNITMPVTLVIISNILPGRPAFAFGITSLALAVGALPAFSGFASSFGNERAIFVAIIVSCLALYYGLRMYSKYSTINNYN